MVFPKVLENISCITGSFDYITGSNPLFTLKNRRIKKIQVYFKTQKPFYL